MKGISMTQNPLFPVFDGHNDTLLDLHNSEHGAERNFFETSTEGHIDLPRASKGGFGGGFFAIFVPTSGMSLSLDEYVTESGYEVPMPSTLEGDYARQQCLAMMARLFRLEAESEGQLQVIHTVAEIEVCLNKGVMAALLHFEGAEAIDEDFNALEVFYRAGLRSLGPVWSRPTAFGHGVPLQFPASPDIGPGLTDAGKALIQACNQLGIMIDLSHLNEAGFWDVAKISESPLVATHSNVHALCTTPRNLTDKQLAAIKESDGMVGLNFGVGFLREDGMWNEDTPLETLVRHVDYLVEHVGIERVGFGSDFDGAKIPQAMGDVTGLPKLLNALRQQGYGDEDLKKIAYQNWLRVLGKTFKPG